MILATLFLAAAAAAAGDAPQARHEGPLAKVMEDAKSGGKRILLGFTAGPGAAARAPAPPTAAHDFFSELELFLRTRSREARSREPGSHLLLAEASAANAAEGSLTGRLSWARYAHPRALLGIPAADAAALGAGDGDRVRVRSNWGQAVLPIRVDRGLPPGVVTAPHRDPAVRGLLRWRREPVLRSLDLRPDRVSLERAGEADRA
ncbi:MAG: hypothetical protein L6R43_10205 [Planctomycetes bacterium]|nr:hypothetical protein [Planctomycetota bacterium]